MSWPNSWQVQPGYGGYSTAAAPPTVAAANPAAAGYSTMTPEQYAQWQQWQQYQQQYAQWHAQYGEQYARQMGKPLPAVAAPMPLQHMGIAATNVPPPVAAVVTTHQPVPAPVMAPTVAPIPAVAAVVAPPMPTTAAPPPPPEPHPDSVAANAPAPPPPETDDSEQSQKTAEELAFDEQFRKWEEEFDNWKRKNANHPDKNAYREYEKKFVECRKKLLERRDQLREKRLAELAAKAPSQPAAAAAAGGGFQYNQPPPPPPPEEEEEDESKMDVGLFKNALGGGGVSGGGIPGLDLINEDEKGEKQNDEEVVEVINLDDEEVKPNNVQVNAKQPVNALASLLKDPKVSELLNVISRPGNSGQGVNLASLGNNELLQQIQSAAGAVINGSPAPGQVPPMNQAKMPEPGGVHTPLSDDRSRTSLHDDRRSVVSMDDRSSRDFDDFNRGPPPTTMRNSNEFNPQGPPPNRGSGGFGFDASVPPPLLDIDLSRPPPPFGSQPPARPIRSDQPSPAPSNTSSTSRRQRQSRWVDGNLRDAKQEPDLDSEPPMRGGDFRNRPPIKDEPFNGSDCLPPSHMKKFFDGPRGPPQQDANRSFSDSHRGPPQQNTNRSFSDSHRGPPQQDTNRSFSDSHRGPPQQDINKSYSDSNQDPADDMRCYEGHQDELQIDPELGTPCAVPKPEWMTEDEYDEIYDRYEHIEVFEERKFKMELAIKVLKERKDRERSNTAPKFGDNRNVNNGGGGGGDGDGAGRWQGGMPKPLLKEEPVDQKPTNAFESRWQGGMPKPLLKEEPGGGQKRANPFANDDDGDYFRPKQVIDYSNGGAAPRVFDYGHSSSGPVAKDVDLRVDAGRNEWRSGPPTSGSKDVDLRRNDWRNDNNSRGDRDERQPPFHGGGGGGRGGRGRFDDFQQQPPPLMSQRFDYNHAPPSEGGRGGGGGVVDAPAFMSDRPPPNYSLNSTSRLAALHDNPNPEEANPCYPSKFILMNDNRPNRPSTKRGKRASSIRKQKLREQQDPQHQLSNSFGSDDHGDIDERQLIPPAFAGSKSEPPPPPVAVVQRPSDYELDMKRGSEESEDPKSPFFLTPGPIVNIEELLLPPGRFKRPQRICFIMRGIPGSGKSYLARMIKDCELKNGGQAPRVLSIDDYFLVEKEEREPDPVTGRPVLVTKSDYEYDADMEEEYMKNLIKAFKRTITERLYNFIIVDCVNERLEHYNEFHNFGRSNGFKVFTCTLQTEMDMCIEQNIHKRSVDDIRAYAARWALCPNDHAQINASSLFDPEETEQPQPTDMDLCSDDELPEVPNADDDQQPPLDEEANEPPQDADDDSNLDGPELGFFTSKWDADTSEQNLARLDGISKPPRRPPTIEDFLQLDDDLDVAGPGGSSSGKKRVRWADIEERKAQSKMRQMGFVVGVTDWSRMMDPSGGSRALTKTKYIERVRPRNRNYY